MIAGHDPVRVLEIQEQCTYEEIAACYKSRQARAYGVGWTYNDNKRK